MAKKIGYPRRPPTLSHEKFKSLTLNQQVYVKSP